MKKKILLRFRLKVAIESVLLFAIMCFLGPLGTIG